MRPTRTQLEALLAATERLLQAREVQMLTSEEWDEVQAAFAGCGQPNAAERGESFSVDAGGRPCRNVIPKRGQPYQHFCDLENYEDLAHNIDERNHGDQVEWFTLEEVRCGIPWTQAAVAFAFFKERGVVVPA